MMYVIYNNDGSIKLTNLNEIITQNSNNVSKIFFAVEGYDTDNYNADATFELSNGDANTLVATISSMTLDTTPYVGWGFSLTNAQTASPGRLLASIELKNLSDVVLFTFPLDLFVNKTTLQPDETTITVAQYNNLRDAMLGKQDKFGLNTLRIYQTMGDANADLSNLVLGQLVYVIAENKLFQVEGSPKALVLTNDNYVKQYPYNETATLQTVYDEVGLNKLFYAKLDNRWQLLMLQETSGNFSFVFWDELGYGQTDTIQDLSENIENFTFHYTGSYFPYVEKNDLSGSLTDDELAILSQPNSVFIYNYSIHGLTEKTATTLRFRKNTDFYSTSSGQLVFRNQYITVSISTKTYSVNVSEEETYKDDKIDTLLNLKEDLANKTTTITSSSTDTQYPSAKAVYDFTYDRTYIDTTFATKSELTRVYKYEGSAAVNTLNSMTKTAQMNGYVYNMSTSGNLVNEDNSTISVSVGDNISFVWQNGDWYWDKMAGSIDLSGYVQKTTKVAGIDLEDDITKQELVEALCDDTLNLISNNPVKNKVIYGEIQRDGWITPNLITGSKVYEIVKELIKPETTFTDGYYLANNSAVSEPLACYTDYLQVYSGQKLYIAKGCGFQIAGEYYNESKVYQYTISMSVGEDVTGGYIKRSGQVWSVPANGYVRINIKIGSKSIASVKSILGTTEKKTFEWLNVSAENIDGSNLNIKENISQSNGTPIISFIRNHMWLKNGSLYTSNEELGSTQTIPLNKATSITVLPLYLYGQEQNIGNGSFVDNNGNFISNIDENAVWDDDNITFTSPVPLNAYGVQLNAVLLPTSMGEKYTTSTASPTNNPSSTLYVVLNNTTKVLNWLELKDGIIRPNNFNLDEIWQQNNISQNDGTPIVPFIRSHMWLKNGNVYSSNTNFGSTQTIVINGISSFRIKPYYKYGKEGSVDNGAFVDENGNWVASLMANATWDESQTYLIVEVPDNAYGVQINATFTSSDKYDISSSNNNNASSSLYYSTQYSINVPWLKVDAQIDWSVIPNNVITYASLTSDVKSRLSLPYDESYKYWDSLNKPFDFQSKTLVAFGDSITAGIANEGSGNYSAGANSYINLFSSKFNMSLNNQAVSGSTITSGVNQLTPICTKIDDYTFLNTTDEFVFIAGGTNDFNSDAPLGQLGDTQTTTFYGALDHICQRLQSAAPNSTVIFITPINVNTDNFPRKASGSTLTLNKYRNAIWEVATKYGFNVVDGSTIGFAKEINTTWGNLMIVPSDGTHPTLAGHALYFRGLCGKLK